MLGYMLVGGVIWYYMVCYGVTQWVAIAIITPNEAEDLIVGIINHENAPSDADPRQGLITHLNGGGSG